MGNYTDILVQATVILVKVGAGLIFLFPQIVLAEGDSNSAHLGTSFGYRPGYLESVKNERRAKPIEMVLIPPKVETEPLTFFGSPLLDDKLTKELQTRYEQDFGRNDTERNYHDISKYTFLDSPGAKSESIQNYNDRQRSFGSFMIKKILEHHVDLFLKSRKEVRPVYQLKDRLSNINLTVKKGYKIHVRYSLSGNSLETRLDNPYEITTKLTLQMGSGFGPSKIERSIFSLEYPWSKTMTYTFYQDLTAPQTTTFIARKKLTRILSALTSFTKSSPVDRANINNTPLENMLLVGLAWTE
ncbi:MAG: hypothetical protein K1X29_05120 [Bdellovibrionales bacterium]|nr:hypothetical protein [Bdellovibrionales bacterium]